MALIKAFKYFKEIRSLLQCALKEVILNVSFKLCIRIQRAVW